MKVLELRWRFGERVSRNVEISLIYAIKQVIS